MTNFKKKIKKLNAGILAGICAVSMVGGTASEVVAGAANDTAETSLFAENSAFPSADEVIAEAATLLGSPYGFGYKGYTGAYYQGGFQALPLATVRQQGVDCSGLIYYTLTHLGYSTTGFSWNNPVPVDTMHWITVNDGCTITYDGITSKIDIEKVAVKTTEHPYWECPDGSTIVPGSMVIAENPYAEDHSWIYIGEFENRDEVVDYLRNIGVSENLITSSTVGDGKGDDGTHWRIESNGSEGVVINNRTDGKQSTALNMYAFRVTKTDVEFTVTKVLNSDNSVKISGTSPIDNSKAVYGVYTDEACQNKVGEITIGDDGTGSIMLPDRQYYVKEISAPTGYDLSKDIVALKANSNVNVEENITSGIIKINKTAEDGVVADREFVVSWTENGKEHSKNVTTNSDGIAEIDGLHVYDFESKSAISYNISELNLETRYEIPKAQDVTLTGGNADLTVAVDFENVLKKGNIRINKLSEDGQNGDREFVISGGGQTYTLVTSADGTAVLADIPVFDGENNPITYTITENNVPVRYVTPESQDICLETGETVEVNFENRMKKFTAEVVKRDSENGGSQGNATLAGAVYGLYRDGERIATYTTDDNGYFITEEYPCGNYTLQELSPPEGYLLNDEIYTLGTEPENYTIAENFVSADVVEDVKKGDISIIKHSDEDENTVENLEIGAEFEIFLKSAGGYENAKDSERDYLITDENGYAKAKTMPYGVYTVHQTKSVNDSEFVPDFDVFIAENGKTYEYILNDAPFKSYIHVTKLDAESGKNVACEGAGFQIFDADGNLVNMGVDTFYTNSEGFLITPETLPYGNYTLVEVQAPAGYVLDPTPVEFSVTSANSEIENAVEIVRVEKSDVAQKGRISVQKTGEIFASVDSASSIFIDENGETVVNPTTYCPVFAEKGLADAVFEVIASEDIVTPDGTVRAVAGEVVGELTTDENGFAETAPLYLGKYEIKEKIAPYGYVLSDESRLVELTYAGQEIAVTDAVGTNFSNDYQGVEISLEKVMESSELFDISAENSYKNVRFGLFAAEEIVAADGTSIPENGLISEVSLNSGKTAVFSEKMPFARYYVQEISTDEHYILNGEKYLVNFEYMGQEMTTVAIDCGPFENTLKKGSISGKKVDEKDEPLAKAVFGIFSTEETEFTEKSAFMTAESDEDGNFSFTEIPYGEYIVHEITAPAGYILSKESYPVTISEDGEIIEITAKNQPVSVEISKRDVYGNELEGAEMQLENSDGEVVEKWTSNGKNHVISGLSIGEYVLKETAAPDGYIVATEIKFTVGEDGAVTVENVDSTPISEEGVPLIVMVDDTTKVKISKQDITTGEELEGAKLQIIDKDEKIVEEWTSAKEPRYIEAKLIAGETYTLRETIAPNGYSVANDVKFTVKADGTVTEVVMKDEIIPETPQKTPYTPSTPTSKVSTVPPTGDTGRNPIGFIMIAVGLSGLICIFITKRKERN